MPAAAVEAMCSCRGERLSPVKGREGRLQSVPAMSADVKYKQPLPLTPAAAKRQCAAAAANVYHQSKGEKAAYDQSLQCQQM